MSGWGIADTAPKIEKIKAESADYLNGLDSCGKIEWSTYSDMFDFYADLIEKAYEQGKEDAQTEPVTDCHDLTDDLISRQKAINAFHYYFRDGFEEDKWWNSTHVLAAIEGLPSEQSKLKWETCFDCPLSHGCPKIKGCTNEQAIEYASQIPNDCPLSAQPEIIHCEFCKHWKNNHLCECLSRYGTFETPKDFFCGYGKAK